MITLGVDSGTQSTKALVVDGDGKVLGRGSAGHSLIDGLPSGAKEQHPDEWWAALVEASKAAIAAAGISPKSIAAVGVSGQQHGFVPVNESGNVIRPAKLWCDTATTAQVERIVENVGGQGTYRKAIGNDLAVGFTASKILWLKETEPENFARLASVLLPHDFLNFRLTGDQTMEAGDASGTGLLDVRNRAWSRTVCEAIDDRLLGLLPELKTPQAPAGVLCDAAAGELGLEAGIPVSTGGGDNMMAAIGSGAVREGTIILSLGTSGVVTSYATKPILDEEGLIACFCDSTGAWLPLLCTMNATISTELIRGLLNLTVEELEKAAASAEAGSGGVRLLPWFEGERTPALPNAAGGLLGLTSRNATPANLARAAMEGVAVSLRWGWGRMAAMGLQGKEIRMTGGGSKSATWRQIIADVFQLPVVCTSESEGAAFGAALQARWQAGPENIKTIVDDSVALDEETRCGSTTANQDVYEEYLDKFNSCRAKCELFVR